MHDTLNSRALTIYLSDASTWHAHPKQQQAKQLLLLQNGKKQESIQVDWASEEFLEHGLVNTQAGQNKKWPKAQNKPKQ